LPTHEHSDVFHEPFIANCSVSLLLPCPILSVLPFHLPKILQTAIFISTFLLTLTFVPRDSLFSPRRRNLSCVAFPRHEGHLQPIFQRHPPRTGSPRLSILVPTSTSLCRLLFFLSPGASLSPVTGLVRLKSLTSFPLTRPFPPFSAGGPRMLPFPFPPLVTFSVLVRFFLVPLSFPHQFLHCITDQTSRRLARGTPPHLCLISDSWKGRDLSLSLFFPTNAVSAAPEIRIVSVYRFPLIGSIADLFFSLLPVLPMLTPSIVIGWLSLLIFFSCLIPFGKLLATHAVGGGHLSML